MKLWILGLFEYFCGWKWHWNIFDLLLVFLAVIDVTLALTQSDVMLPGLTVARVARLFRFVRLARIARTFKELSLMVAGLVSRMRTLFWAAVIFITMIYIFGVLLRQTVGKDTEDPIQDVGPFKSVPFAMFTIFQCLTVDCSGESGDSIVVQLAHSQHATFIFSYSLVLFFTIFWTFQLGGCNIC